MTTKFLLSSDDNTRSGLLKKKIIHYYMANGDATIAEVCKEMNLILLWKDISMVRIVG